jgi:FkbM family methyltransferase
MVTESTVQMGNPANVDRTEKQVLRGAKSLYSLRPLTLYPRQLQHEDWQHRSLASYVKEAIWSYFHERNQTVPFPVIWHRELKVTLNLGDELSRPIFVDGCYDPNEFVFLENTLAPGAVMVDVGAHEGIYSLFAARCVGEGGRVWSVEPSKRERKHLVHNIKRNDLRNLTVLGVAAGHSDGKASLQIAEGTRSGRNMLIADSTRSERCVGLEAITVRSLDSLAAQHNWTRLDVLKIDAEGEEIRILRGASRILKELRPIILFEADQNLESSNGNSVPELIEGLRAHDYIVHGFNPATGLPNSAPNCDDLNLVAFPREKTTPL